MAKECWLKKKEDKQQCFKCDKEEYITKDCKKMQSIKKCKVQEESDNEDKEKGQGLATISSRHSTRDLSCKFPE